LFLYFIPCASNEVKYRCDTMSVIGGRVVAEVKGALFDVDGTLLDSMSGFFPSWVAVGKDYGITLTEEEFYAYGGWPLPEIVKDLHKKCLGTDATDAFVEEFLDKKRVVRVQQEKERGPPAAIEAVIAVARAHVAAGIPIYAATSGIRDVVEHHLKAAGLDDLFPQDRIITAADLPKGRGKPNPDIFIEAARRIGVAPQDCIAYEDAPSGMESAWRAGCQVIDVRDYPGYPLPAGLKSAMVKERAANRSWMV